MSKKEEQIKKGRKYLIWAGVCLILSLILYSAQAGGLIAATVNFAMVILFFAGLAYLIIGLMNKE